MGCQSVSQPNDSHIRGRLMCRLIGPGRECQWHLASAAILRRAAPDTVPKVRQTLAGFQQQLDVVLATCSCWEAAVGTAGPFCQDRGAARSRVGTQIAASTAVTAVAADDPSAVAEAAEKAADNAEAAKKAADEAEAAKKAADVAAVAKKAADEAEAAKKAADEAEAAKKADDAMDALVVWLHDQIHLT